MMHVEKTTSPAAGMSPEHQRQVVDLFGDPVLLYPILLTVPGLAFYLFYRVTRWLFPNIAPEVLVASAASIAAFCAVIIYEMHAHSTYHFYVMARDCLAAADYCGRFNSD